MKYSVCIINWNWLEVLKMSVEKLIQERETVDMDFIVLDNGSTDGSKEWLLKQTGFERIFNEENKGAAIGRNQLIYNAIGDERKPEYILMMDSDILYIPGSLDYLASRFNDVPDNAKCIGFNPLVFTNELNKYKECLPKQDAQLKRHYVQFASYALTQYGLFKADIFPDVMFDENYGIGWAAEDDDLFMQMQEHNWDVYQLNHHYYHAKETPKWNDIHEINMKYHYARCQYFKKKWGWIK
jgi:glycosyltransferase involved in cell wall biosynthesis